MGDHNIEEDVGDVPVIGTKFGSEEEAYNFYNEYRRSMCFSIRKDYANWRREPNKSKKVLTSRMFVCNKGGVRKADKRDIHTVLHREETRIGCPAKIGLIWQLLKLPICHLLRHHWIIQTLRCSLSNPQEQWSIILHPNKFW